MTGGNGQPPQMSIPELVVENLPNPVLTLGADDRVRALDLVAHGLADVVEERASLGDRRVHTQFRSDRGGELCGFDEVAQHVLPVRGSVPELSQEAHELRVEIGDADLERGVLARPTDLLLDVALRSLVDLLDAGRVDPAVGDESLQGHPSDLPTHGIEAGEDDGFRGVVDDEVHAQVRRLQALADFSHDAELLGFARHFHRHFNEEVERLGDCAHLRQDLDDGKVSHAAAVRDYPGNAALAP